MGKNDLADFTLVMESGNVHGGIAVAVSNLAGFEVRVLQDRKAYISTPVHRRVMQGRHSIVIGFIYEL